MLLRLDFDEPSEVSRIVRRKPLNNFRCLMILRSFLWWMNCLSMRKQRKLFRFNTKSAKRYRHNLRKIVRYIFNNIFREFRKSTPSYQWHPLDSYGCLGNSCSNFTVPLGLCKFSTAHCALATLFIQISGLCLLDNDPVQRFHKL